MSPWGQMPKLGDWALMEGRYYILTVYGWQSPANWQSYLYRTRTGRNAP